MSVDREYRIRVTTVGDPSGAQATAAGLDKTTEATDQAAKSSERAGIGHRALHAAFSQVGAASKGLEIGLMALSGVMLGSLTFGIYAVGEGLRLLIAHFQKQKEVALESAKATVQFWTDALQGNVEARQAASDYADALLKIIKNVDDLKRNEGEEEAILKKLLEERLKIIDAEREAEIAKAAGDKEEVARINARYGRYKAEVELQNEAAEIDLKKRHLAEQTAEVQTKEAAANAAAAAKVAGAPGREEANAAEQRMAKLTEELAKLQAARLAPTALEALRQEVARRSGEASYGSGANGVPMVTAAGAARERLEEATAAEDAYAAAQQEYEQGQADIERFKTGTKKLADAVEQATAALGKAVEAMRATDAEISKAEGVHRVNVDATTTIQAIKDRAEIEMAGGKYDRTSQTVLHEVRAMAGTSEGARMSGEDTAYFNNLLAAARAAHKEDLARAVIAELKNMHVDEAKKWQDLLNAIKQIRAEGARILHTLPGN